jgi:3-isopropylmalate dehydrogenase
VTPTVVVMPGDGIGRQVLPEALRVLDAVGFAANYLPAEVGWDCWCAEGNALPARTLALLDRHGLGLFGAITSKPRAQAEAELSPALRGQGLRYTSPVLEMRRRLGLEIALRPCRSLPGNRTNFVRRGPDGTLEEPRLDVTLITQNTECLYAGVDVAAPTATLRAALGEGMARFGGLADSELALSVRVMSRPACLRVARFAFAYAKANGFARVTLCDKWGVMPETAGLFLEAAAEAAAEHAGIALERVNVDAQVLFLTRRPEDFGVILSSALLGDILSDGFAGLVGGLGFAPAANLTPPGASAARAIFEPAHGSAPRYAALEPAVVNPIAMILAAAMLLDHVGEAGRAERVRRAVARVVADGRVRSFDMMGLPGGPGALDRGAATTRALGDAICAAVVDS